MSYLFSFDFDVPPDQWGAIKQGSRDADFTWNTYQTKFLEPKTKVVKRVQGDPDPSVCPTQGEVDTVIRTEDIDDGFDFCIQTDHGWAWIKIHEYDHPRDDYSGRYARMSAWYWRSST